MHVYVFMYLCIRVEVKVFLAIAFLLVKQPFLASSTPFSEALLLSRRDTSKTRLSV